MTRVLTVALLLLGAARWTAFLWYGTDDLLTWMDWLRITYYYASIRDAWASGTLPLYYAPYYDAEWLNFMWAHPSSPTLPYLLLVPFVRPGLLNLGVCLTYYALGAAGVVAFAKRAALSWPVAVVFGVVALGNGYLADNLGVGHDAFIACFLFPWWLVFLWDFAEGTPTRYADLSFGALMALVMLGGGAHLALWWWTATVIVIALQPRVWVVGARAGGWFVLFAAVKLIPMVTVYPLECLKHYPQAMGFHQWGEVWAALMGGQPAVLAYGPFQWDRSCYFGIASALIVLGACCPWGTRWSRGWRFQLALLPSLLAMIGDTAAPWKASSNPLLAAIFSDRFTTRLIIVPAMVWVAQACTVLEDWRRHSTPRVQQVVSGVLLAYALGIGVQFWRYQDVTAPQLRGGPPDLLAVIPPAPNAPVGVWWGIMPIAAVPHNPAVHNKPDLTFNDIYRSSIRLGILVTLVGMVLAATDWYRRRD